MGRASEIHRAAVDLVGLEGPKGDYLCAVLAEGSQKSQVWHFNSL